MNYHQPQSIQSLEELKQITMVPTQIISPGTSKPCMKIMVDTMIGAYLLTRYDNKFSKQQFQNLLTYSPYYSGKLPEPEWVEDGVPYWSGKQLISTILPDISITHMKDLKIVRGELTDGYLNESSLGTKPSGIIQQIYNVYGTNLMKRFMNDTEKIVTRFMTQECFSISFGDTVITKEQRKEVYKIINENIQNAYDIIIRAQQGIYAQDLDDKLRAEKLEADMDAALSDVAEKVKKYIGSIVQPKNGLKEAIESGSTKGSMLHLTQIMALVGKQDVWGKRVPSEFTYRTLPHFAKYDLSPESKGFTKTGFIEGINAADSFFGAMSGRNGKIDTAIKTADSGYTSRKFVKATEDLMVNYDFTVRNAANKIVQFAYGDDNMDPAKIERIDKIILLEFNNEQMSKFYQFKDMNDRGFWSTFMTEDAIEEMMKDGRFNEILHEEYNELLSYRYELRNKIFKNVEMIGDVYTYLPINPLRMIQSILVKYDIQKFSISDMTPQYVIQKFNELMDSIVQYFPQKEKGFVLQKMILKSYLSTKKVLYEYRMSKMTFDELIATIQMKMMNSLVSPGEMVGVIAAQTLGEGTTQMTLNTFHSIGKGALVITEGLPRLNEIIKLTKKMKNKNMKIYLKDEYSLDKEEAKKVKTRFGYTKLNDILSESEIIYVGDESYTDDNEEREYIRSYREFCEIFNLEQIEENCLSPWMIRFVFDKESMMNRNISILEIQEKIKEKEPEDLECVFSDDSANNVVLRIRFKNDKSGNFLDFMRKIEKNLSEMTIRGIDGIEIAELMEKSKLKYNVDGSYESIKEWTITTKGSNMIEILADNAVDANRTVTNDINEFAEIFGIEAARNLLVMEYNNVYASNGFNPRHVELVSDMMSYRGKLMQIERHGTLKNPDIGPIGKASFEAVMDVLTKAALFAEKDNMKGVSSNIFAGQFCKAGTNAFEIIMDDEKMMKPVPKQKYVAESKFMKEPTEKEIDMMLNTIYEDVKVEDNVLDEDFTFGFGLEYEKESVLTGTHVSQILKKDPVSGVMERITVENMNMGEEKIEIPTNNMMFNMDEKIEIPQDDDEVILEEKINIPQYNEEVKAEPKEDEKPKKRVLKKKTKN
jgi:DNA-directed RNA polymerase II subunit RPB1